MKPPFSLITFLLAGSTLLAIMAFGVFISTKEPRRECGVKSHPEIICGNAIEQLKFKESMDSSTYEKYLAGKQLFKEAGCAFCHNIETKKVGPALRGISQRRDSIWIKKAILNFDKLIAQKDSQALQVFNEYGQMQMPQHEFLGNEDLEKIILYLNRGRDF